MAIARRRVFRIALGLFLLLLGGIVWNRCLSNADPRFVGTWMMNDPVIPLQRRRIVFSAEGTSTNQVLHESGNTSIEESIWSWKVEKGILELRYQRQPQRASSTLVAFTTWLSEAFTANGPLPVRFRVLEVEGDRIRLQSLPVQKEYEPQDFELIRVE